MAIFDHWKGILNQPKNGMDNTNLLKVNEPNVVHETIDGETILLDLNTGNYYSLEGPGAIIWEYIGKTGDRNRLIEIMSAKADGNKAGISESVSAFIDQLVEEKLLVSASGPISPGDTGALEAQLQAAAENFTPPSINKYSDMQDLLLLDPIHDVDEKGWPESMDASGQEENSSAT